MFILRYRKPHRYGRHLDRGDSPRHPERSALGMADMLTWVASDALREAKGARRQIAAELARDGDEEEWRTDNVFRWGPAAVASVADEDDLDDIDGDEADHGADPLSPDVPSTSSTSAAPPNRRARRKAAAKARKR